MQSSLTYDMDVEGYKENYDYQLRSGRQFYVHNFHYKLLSLDLKIDRSVYAYDTYGHGKADHKKRANKYGVGFVSSLT